MSNFNETINPTTNLDGIKKILSKTDKLSGREKAIIELQQLQYDYADGYGHYGPMISKLTDLLSKYKELYSLRSTYLESQDFKEIKPKLTLTDVFNEEFKKNYIRLIGLAGVYLVLWLLSPSGLIFDLFYLATIVLFFMSYSGLALCQMIPLVIHFLESEGLHIFSFEVHMLVEWIIIIGFLAYYLINPIIENFDKMNARKETNEKILNVRKMINEIENTRKELLKLKDPLYKEYNKVRNDYIHKYSQYLSDTEKETLCKDLPDTFWWEIPRDEVKHININLKATYHEFDNVVNYNYIRTKSNIKQTFTAPYSALYPNMEQFKQNYISIYNGCQTVGLCYEIDYEVDKVLETETYTKTHEEDKYSGFQKTLAMGSYVGLGNDIDKAYNNGEISYSQYQELRNSYFAGGVTLDDKLSDKITVEETGTYHSHDYYKSKVGSIILLKDPQNNGFVVVDISGNSQHINNIVETLHPQFVGGDYKSGAFFTSKINITRILGDPVKRDPKVVAKMHFMHQNCR